MLELYKWALSLQLFISSVEITQETMKLSIATPLPNTHIPRSKPSAISKKFLRKQFRQEPSPLGPWKLVSFSSHPLLTRVV